MESSLNNSSVFFAGSTASKNQNSTKTAGIITACEFNKEMKIKGEIILEGERLLGVTCIKRLKGRDELVIGGFRDILILEFFGSSFEIIGKFKDVHSGFVSDFCFFGDSVFSVCSDEDFIVKVDFEEENGGV